MRVKNYVVEKKGVMCFYALKKKKELYVEIKGRAGMEINMLI